MVEGSANEMGESAFLDVMFTAQGDDQRSSSAFQEKIRAKIGVAKEENYETFPWAKWRTETEKFITVDKARGALLKHIARSQNTSTN